MAIPVDLFSPPTPSSISSRLSIICGPTSPALSRSTFGDLLRARCEQNGGDIAIISQHQNEILTYSDLQRRSEDLAGGLLRLGVEQGDRVAVMLGNRSEYVDIFFACAQIGALVTLINFAYSTSELTNALRSTASKVLITTSGSGRYNYTDILPKLVTNIPSLVRIVLLHDIACQFEKLISSPFFVEYRDVIQLGRQRPINSAAYGSKVSCMDILNLQFTSGSTGAPKAAALTHSGMMNSARYISLQMKVDRGDKIVVPVPLFHAFGLIIGLCTAFVAGASAVLPSEYFEAGAVLKAVDKYACTGLYGVTTMFIDELAHPEFSSMKRSSLRFGVMAGSAMPEELLARVITKFPIPELYTNWGMTELSSIATMTTATDPVEKKMRTAGRLLPNFIGKIVAPDSSISLPWGARGEIVISGFGVMHSYFGDELRTEMALKSHVDDLQPGQAGLNIDGQMRTWLHTGDEGYLDKEGYFVITGRIKDLIIRGGENISPLEIEERLFAHPAIKQAAVFGIPSQRYGEEVAAILELEDKTEQRPTNEEIRSWVRKALSRYKTPVRIWWLGDVARGVPMEWPKTANGKLRKKDIRKVGEDLLKESTEAGISLTRTSL